MTKEPTDRALKEKYCFPSRAIDRVHHRDSPPKSPYRARFLIPLPTKRQHDAHDEIPYRQKPCCLDVLGRKRSRKKLGKAAVQFRCFVVSKAVQRRDFELKRANGLIPT
jgi:hypothetical protein